MQDALRALPHTLVRKPLTRIASETRVRLLDGPQETSNLAFSEWPGIFPNGACATALFDRIIHHADIITIEG